MPARSRCSERTLIWKPSAWSASRSSTVDTLRGYLGIRRSSTRFLANGSLFDLSVMGSGFSQRRQDTAFKGRSSLPPPRDIACRMTPYRSRIAAGQPFPAISAGTWDQSCSGFREARRPASRAAPATVRNTLRERLHITCRCGGIDHAAVKNPFITRPPVGIPLPASLRDAVIVLARAGVGIFLTLARLLARQRIPTNSPNATIRRAVSRCIFVAPHAVTQ